MGNKNKVIVNILGQDYPLMSDDDRDYMQKVSYLVDDRMREISNANSKLGKTMVAVLTALNLADDYVKASDEKTELEAQVENLLRAIEENTFNDDVETDEGIVNNIETFIVEGLEVNEDLDDNKDLKDNKDIEDNEDVENDEDVEVVIKENSKESITIDSSDDHENFLFFKQEIDELREKIEKLSGAVVSRESELEQSSERIRLLEEKLSTNEEVLVETKNKLYKSEEELEEFIKEFDGATN